MTDAIKAAIDELSTAGGGHLCFPEGTYLSGSFEMKSNIDLHLEEGAVLMASPNKTLYFETGAQPYFIYRKNSKISASLEKEQSTETVNSGGQSEKIISKKTSGLNTVLTLIMKNVRLRAVS